jgi:hypothetical protein
MSNSKTSAPTKSTESTESTETTKTTTKPTKATNQSVETKISTSNEKKNFNSVKTHPVSVYALIESYESKLKTCLPDHLAKLKQSYELIADYKHFEAHYDEVFNHLISNHSLDQKSQVMDQLMYFILFQSKKGFNTSLAQVAVSVPTEFLCSKTLATELKTKIEPTVNYDFASKLQITCLMDNDLLQPKIALLAYISTHQEAAQKELDDMIKLIDFAYIKLLTNHKPYPMTTVVDWLHVLNRDVFLLENSSRKKFDSRFLQAVQKLFPNNVGMNMEVAMAQYLTYDPTCITSFERTFTLMEKEKEKNDKKQIDPLLFYAQKACYASSLIYYGKEQEKEKEKTNSVWKEVAQLKQQLVDNGLYHASFEPLLIVQKQFEFYNTKNRAPTLEETKEIAKASKKCDYCQQWLMKPLNCSRCKKVYYCDDKCQKLDWKLHKSICTHK